VGRIWVGTSLLYFIHQHKKQKQINKLKTKISGACSKNNDCFKTKQSLKNRKRNKSLIQNTITCYYYYYYEIIAKNKDNKNNKGKTTISLIKNHSNFRTIMTQYNTFQKNYEKNIEIMDKEYLS